MAVSELGVMCRARADEASANRTVSEEIATTRGLPTMKVAKESKALVWLVLWLLGGEKRESSAGCNEKAAGGGWKETGGGKWEGRQGAGRQEEGGGRREAGGGSGKAGREEGGGWLETP